MRHNEVKMCRVLLGHMVVPSSYCKGKEIPPWHNIPKFLQACGPIPSSYYCDECSNQNSLCNQVA